MNKCITWQIISLFLLVFIFISAFSLIKADNKRIKSLKNQVIEIKVNAFKKNIFENERYFENVTITAYNPFKNQTDNTPYKTAIMEIPKPGWTCAVSRDMMNLLGRKIYIENVGVFKVNDLMNKRFTNRIDICMGKKRDAISFGKKNCNVVVLNDNTEMNK